MATKRFQMKDFLNTPYNMCCVVLGVLLIINAFICAILYTNIKTFVVHMEHKQLALSPNTLFLELWNNPPMTPKLHVYIFNLTNAYQYFSGEDSKPHFEVCPKISCKYLIILILRFNSIYYMFNGIYISICI